MGDFYRLFFEACPEAVVEFGPEVEEVFGVGGPIADVYAFDHRVVEFMEPVDDACSDAYFVNADGLWVVFGNGFDDEPGRAHGVELLVLVEGYDSVALPDADYGAVGPEACDVDSYLNRLCAVACVLR